MAQLVECKTGDQRATGLSLITGGFTVLCP